MTEFAYQSVRFVVLDEILELHGSWSLLGLPGPATDTILEFQFAILPVYVGPAAAMDGMSCSFLSFRVLNE